MIGRIPPITGDSDAWRNATIQYVEPTPAPWVGVTAPPPAPPRQWEYFVVNGIVHEPEMNRIGAEGWELVNFVVDGSWFGYVFKRPK